MNFFGKFQQSVKKQDLGVYGIHVYQNGEVLGEHRFRSNDRENLCSASKIFVSVGVGIAQGEGRFQLSDYILDFFPEYKKIASLGSEKITIEHLLQMSSGHVVEDFDSYNKKDRAELFFETEIAKEVGSSFFYEDLCTYMLGRIVEKVCGVTMLEYLKPRLFQVLEIVNPQWNTCQLGHTSCSGGLYLTTEEFSRIGIMLLHNGVYKGKQVVPMDYVSQMHSKWMDTKFKDDPETQGGYSYQVWKCTLANAYRASGMYGQFCVILKDYDAVITATSHNENEPYDILRAIWKDILPHLSKKEEFIYENN